MIKLTTISDRAFYVNPDYIVNFYEIDEPDAFSAIVLARGSCPYFVKESTKEIMDKINMRMKYEMHCSHQTI